MNWLGEFYQWFWFTTECWLSPADRRPYTFIMMDYIFLHPWPAWSMIAGWYAGMAVLLFFCPPAAATLIGLSAFVLAHVVWGGPWLEGRQECPEYLGE